MRLIHINPWRRTVTEIEVDGDGDGCVDYEALRAAVFHGRPPHQRGYLRRVALGNGVAAYMDDDAWELPVDEQRFCCVRDPHDLRPVAELAGHVVLAGDDGWGSALELPRRVNTLAVGVQWLDAREVVGD